MPLRLRDRGLIVGAPIALTYRAIAGSNSPGGATNAYIEIANVGPESENRTLIIFARMGGQTPASAFFCGQLLPVRHTSTDSGGAVNAIFTGHIPKNVSGPLVIFSPVGFNGFSAYSYTVTGLASPIPVDSNSSASATATARSIDLNTRSGGIIIGAAFNNISAAQSCTWTGDQTPTENAENSSGGILSTASILDTNEDAANTLTATYAVISTTSCFLFGASFR